MQLAENVVVAGKFRLNRLLGRGGMGSVWYATHLALDIPCAVKFIEGDFAAVPEMQARFQREAKAAAALRSPHVVQILDHDIWEGMPFIAMELLDGEELSKRVSRLGRIPPAELNAIMSQVCRALTKAHGQGIIHRDLKPDNIFLVRDDDREIAKVLDFGIAKSKNANLDIGSNTKTGAMLGTPYYMSPEQAQGNKQIDARSDLWALGVIAFECLTGQRPFESDALGDLLMQIMVKPLPRASEIAPELPRDFDAWFQKACARDPNERFGSAKELSDALAKALNAGVSTEIMAPKEVRDVLQAGMGATMPLVTPNPLNTPNPAVFPQQGMAPMGAPAPAATTGFAGELAGEIPKKGAPIGLIVGAALAVLVVVGIGIGVGEDQGRDLRGGWWSDRDCDRDCDHDHDRDRDRDCDRDRDRDCDRDGGHRADDDSGDDGGHPRHEPPYRDGSRLGRPEHQAHDPRDGYDQARRPGLLIHRSLHVRV